MWLSRLFPVAGECNASLTDKMALPPQAFIILFVPAHHRNFPCKSHAPCHLFTFAVGDRRALILLQHRRGRVGRRQRTKGRRTKLPRQRPPAPFCMVSIVWRVSPSHFRVHSLLPCVSTSYETHSQHNLHAPKIRLEPKLQGPLIKSR